MLIDLLVLGILALGTFRGGLTGTIQQFGQWLGLALGRAVSKPLALVMTLALARDLGFPSANARVALSVLCFATFYVLGTILARHLLHGSVGHHAQTKPDQIGGALLGLGKAAAIVFVSLSFMLFFSPKRFAHSLAADVVRRHNYFAVAPAAVLVRLEKLTVAIRDPQSAQTQALANDPGVKAALTDKSLVHAIQSRDWATLQNDPRITALLKDPRILGPLSDPLDEK